jgi:HEPN domain-containing protein
MRREIEIWIKQSEKDFENAKKNYELKEYYLTAFLVQQSLEKALKGMYIKVLEEYPDKTHSLIFLVKELNLPKELLSKLRKINPDFIYTRYPDLDGVPPYEAYDEEIAQERLKDGEEILKWILKKIKE